MRLGDTNLIVEVERDLAEYGNELVYGWGKNVRAGMMMGHGRPGDSELDTVIPGVLIIDPLLGVMKGDIGIKDGLITGVGRAGNPNIMDGVDLEIGTNTLVRFGAGLIATPGGVDSHVHLVTPKLIPVAVSSGMTTLIGGGLSQNAQFKIHRTFEALERMPVNVGLQGLGSATHPAPMLESLEAGACGFKVHEDTGAYPDVIDACLKVADAHDVSVALHTDGLQESARVDETVDAIAGRAVHAYHVEGAGGGARAGRAGVGRRAEHRPIVDYANDTVHGGRARGALRDDGAHPRRAEARPGGIGGAGRQAAARDDGGGGRAARHGRDTDPSTRTRRGWGASAR